jgi:hypothetical protein
MGSMKGVTDSCRGRGKGRTESVEEIECLSAKGKIASWNITFRETKTVCYEDVNWILLIH